jgi:hypothetical protein
LLIAAVLFGITAGCSSGGSSPTTTAPTNLAYPQTAITATTGQAISTNTPTVTGTVTAYSVAPALPAGLSLNPTTGAISGSPTAAAVQASYTITAANSSGSTTTTVQITVNVAVVTPANLVYPQASITANVGQAITTDTPTVTGAVTAYSVSPALPAGLGLSTTTGAISGTPTAVAAQASYTVTASNSSGSTTATVQITVSAAVAPPANLAYPQTSITAAVGQAIPTDTPTVTGTVTAYSVNPALPAGLGLSTTTGAISGTPTAVAAQATYTVTATNSAGFATTFVNILVNAAVPPPSALVYPQTTINALVGQPILPDVPTVTGTVTSFSINPALPTGLSFSTGNGAITGTGTAASPQTTYTVTAANQGGGATATVKIAALQLPPTLLDVGHASGISQIRVSASNVLSQDSSAHWVLWNYATNSEIASGDQPLSPYGPGNSPVIWPVDMANQIFVVGQTNALDIRSTTDGHLISEIQSPQIDPSDPTVKSWWKLATDGSYICSGTSTGLTVWSSAGQRLFSRPGDYSTANAFAAPGQIQVAAGPAGQNVIETVLATDGASTSGPAFSGTFNRWFLDGQRFFTNTGSTYWIYSAASVQQSILSLASGGTSGGMGNWFWSGGDIYAVGANTPSASFPLPTGSVLVPSGNTIGILSTSPTPSVSVIDLSGASPTKTDYPLPVAAVSTYAATSGSQWIIGNQHGVVLDGASSSTTPRYFGMGQVWSMTGSSNLVAIATANGNISYYSPSSTSTTPVGTINFSSSKIALSSDGTVLVAEANQNDYAYETDRTLKVFSLPSGNLIYSVPFQYGLGNLSLVDFSLSGSGTMTGLITETLNNSPTPSTYTSQVTPTTGGPAVWSVNTLTDGINLSPDGTLIAVSTGFTKDATTTNIYTNGMLTTAVNGYAVGWIDNNQLLVNNYVSVHVFPGTYSTASIYSATGSLISTPTLPEVLTFQPVNSSALYSPALNTIFALPSGNTLYTSSTPASGQGAVVGSNIVFTSGSRIVVDTR